MKLKLMIRLLLLVGLLSGFAPGAQAFYNPSVGRWLSRDPIGETGGIHLYCFVRNESVFAVDLLGLEDYVGYFKWTHKPQSVEAMGYYIGDLGPLPGPQVPAAVLGRTKPKTTIDAVCVNACEWVPQANANTIFSIILNSRLNPFERTGSYGHEQRHVQRFIEQYSDFMEAEDELWGSKFFTSQNACQRFLNWRINEILAGINRINKTGVNHTSYHPTERLGYDPIGGMPLDPLQDAPP